MNLRNRIPALITLTACLALAAPTQANETAPEPTSSQSSSSSNSNQGAGSAGNSGADGRADQVRHGADPEPLVEPYYGDVVTLPSFTLDELRDGDLDPDVNHDGPYFPSADDGVQHDGPYFPSAGEDPFVDGPAFFPSADGAVHFDGPYIAGLDDHTPPPRAPGPHGLCSHLLPQGVNNEIYIAEVYAAYEECVASGGPGVQVEPYYGGADSSFLGQGD